MKFVYLVQGAAARIRQLPLPAGAEVFVLCYDEDVRFDFAAVTIFDSKCSWAEGRNRLVDIALASIPTLDYLIICDDDVAFVEGSFERFEQNLVRTNPLAAQPLMPKARQLNGSNHLLRSQAALVIDEQMYALHRSVVGVQGVCPLVTEYDEISWHAPCLIFEYVALTRLGRSFHQYNDVVVENTNHTWISGATNYKIGQPGAAFEAFKRWIDKNFPEYDEGVLTPYWKGEHKGVDVLKFRLIRSWRLFSSTFKRNGV